MKVTGGRLASLVCHLSYVVSIMTDLFFRRWEAKLDPDRAMTSRQYRKIKWQCGTEHRLRAESVARQVAGRDLADLNQVDAHDVIVWLDDYRASLERPAADVLNREFGQALNLVTRNRRLVDEQTRALALLATNRVATRGQLGRYIFGLEPQTYARIPELIQELMRQMMAKGVVGCERDFQLPDGAAGRLVEVYFLTEKGSDLLHRVAPHVNYHARPGLPPHSRVYHELCVTAARLQLQAANHLLDYDPESEIKSEFRKAFNRRLREGKGGGEGEEFYGGCGDFRALLVEPQSSNCRPIEVEIIIRSRLREVASKPARMTHYFTVSRHRAFLIELTQGKFAELVPDLLEPCQALEPAVPATRMGSKRATVSEDRLRRVRTALARMGGIGTPASVAVLAGLQIPTVSEALAELVAKGETAYCDGFGLEGKAMGRNLRLFLPQGRAIASIFEFGRLLTAARFVSDKLASLFNEVGWEVTIFDPDTGILALSRRATRSIAIAVIDDVSDAPERVVSWVKTAQRLASEAAQRTVRAGKLGAGTGQNQVYQPASEPTFEGQKGYHLARVFIVACNPERLESLRRAGDFSVIDVSIEAKKAASTAAARPRESGKLLRKSEQVKPARRR
jgi:hypothetical protein